MVPILIVTGAIWVIIFLICSPYWMTCTCLLPFCVYCLTLPPADLKWLYLLMLLPVIPLPVIDIQVIRPGFNFKGVWKYLVYLPSVILAVIFTIHFPHLYAKDGMLTKIYTYIVFTFFIILLTKHWFTNPILLLINRLNTNQVNLYTGEIQAQVAKKSGRAFSFYIQIHNQEDLEVSGFWHFYLKFKKVAPKDVITFNFKQGWLGIEYVSGFPTVIRQ